eukprot:TRINITY_DN169_c0_g3_i1.p5 TRINITY_DN169_c0_g3~~TRINITY_DN169_c0_g3_i1.p5  ORF type:complete len:194 (+),score=9.36 TRINITY_DN169_c0_g3_i1:584-1165(+)
MVDLLIKWSQLPPKLLAHTSQALEELLLTPVVGFQRLTYSLLKVAQGSQDLLAVWLKLRLEVVLAIAFVKQLVGAVLEAPVPVPEASVSPLASLTSLPSRAESQLMEQAVVVHKYRHLLLLVTVSVTPGLSLLQDRVPPLLQQLQQLALLVPLLLKWSDICAFVCLFHVLLELELREYSCIQAGVPALRVIHI